jgi:hypothetical protein
MAVKRSMNESSGLGCEEVVGLDRDAATGVMLEPSRPPVNILGANGP